MKTCFICTGLDSQGIETKQAPKDANCFIVRTALEKSEEYEHVIIAGEDGDLSVLLNGLGSRIVFQKSGRGGTGYEQFSSTFFIRGELSFPPGIELFLHAFTGCDITSALLWQGKTKMLGVLPKQPYLLDAANKFLNHNAIHER